MNFFLSLVFLTTFLFQSNNYKLISNLAVEGSFLTTDHLGNSYIIAENQLLLYDTLGKKINTYSNKNMGNLSFVDASNPHKILLFYKDFAQIETLDSKLALQSNIALRDLNIQLPLVVASSYNEGIWIFDQSDFQLKRLDGDLRITNESGNISQTIGINIQPNFMLEDDKWLYVNNPQSGILVFDIYGTYYKTIPIKEINSFQILNEEIVYQKEGALQKYHLKSLQQNEVSIPNSDTTIINIRMTDSRLHILKKQNFELYAFNYL